MSCLSPAPIGQHSPDAAARCARRCSLVLLLAIALACVPAFWVGTGTLQLFGAWRELNADWGPMLAQHWATDVPALMRACSLPRQPPSGTLPDWLHAMPALGAILAACSRTPVAVIGHLLALAGWLLLLLPLAVAVLRSAPIGHGSAAGAWCAGCIGPWLRPATLLWLPSAQTTIKWAPLVAGLCLWAWLAKRDATTAGSAAPCKVRSA